VSFIIFVVVILMLIGLVAGGFYLYPKYGAYNQRLAGQAELQRAESSRRIEVETAKAKLDSAALLSQAEIERAKGVAEANKIIADSLGGPEGYLRWRYIEMLATTGETNNRDIIYIPTEAGLPILEAGRLGEAGK
jgi:regulator of protease activity HflC (stomatin/prohibitin superfamily)